MRRLLTACVVYVCLCVVVYMVCARVCVWWSVVYMCARCDLHTHVIQRSTGPARPDCLACVHTDAYGTVQCSTGPSCTVHSV